ncbi:MAG: DUF72 domain-containing protein [candidate division WS1 bacterium]|jgi:uncharacterized protein YecE (DUF72 family)|nr:DUF72 domain-containing protein [candidate division WS1 bacterium]
MAKFLAGTSGYQYDHWSGVFYPEDLPSSEWFEYYAERFSTVEINNTFYGLPDTEVFADWRRRAPEGFTYILKYSRYGSHLKKLKDPEGHVATFIERSRPLHDLMGPILVQLPPNWSADPDRLRAFLDVAPPEFRWALEVRDPAWLQEPIYDILRDHNSALVIHDMIEDHPEVLTADWVYLRYHGGPRGRYTYQRMAAEAAKVREHLAAGRDVYAFFNNDAHGWALENARQLIRYVTG